MIDDLAYHFYLGRTESGLLVVLIAKGAKILSLRSNKMKMQPFSYELLGCIQPYLDCSMSFSLMILFFGKS